MSLPKISRSRLGRPSFVQSNTSKNSILTVVASTSTILIARFSTFIQGFLSTQRVKEYRHRLPQFAIAMGLSFLLLQLMQKLSPTAAAHILFPNSYLPIMSLWFLCWWYFGSFFLLSSQRGAILASICSAWLYTRLQLILIPWWLWPTLCAVWITLELLTAKIRARRI